MTTGRSSSRILLAAAALWFALGALGGGAARAQTPFVVETDGGGPRSVAPWAAAPNRAAEPAPQGGGAPSLVPSRPGSASDPPTAAPAPPPVAAPSATTGGGVRPFDMGVPPSDSIVPSIGSGTAPPAVSPGPSLTAPGGGDTSLSAGVMLDRVGVDRPILLQPDLRLVGETDYWSGQVYLSEAEAQRGAAISVGFVNSVLVMPEASRLRVSINGRPVLEVPIDASDRPRQYDARLPADALQTGANRVRIDVLQRHRVDCTINATFELWTQLVPEMTGLSFDGGPVPVSSLSDLPSIGVGENGATSIRVVRVGASGPRQTASIIAAVQAATVLGRFAHPVVDLIEPRQRLQPAPGLVRLVVGTTADVRAATDIGAGEAVSRPVLTLLPDPLDQVPTIVIAAPTDADVDSAIARFIVQAERSVDRSANGLGRWHAPDYPILEGGDRITLGELGVRTEEFSGRRFQTHFTVSLPADFYAAAYGEAQLLLDAAFAPEVQPGSSIDIYVNQALAVNYTYTSQSGDVFRQRPIKIPLKSFRPGPNIISIEGNLRTDADDRCLPGTTMPGRDRFVLFNTSSFRMPVFARFAALPNLAGFAAGALPYRETDDPVEVFVPGDSRNTLSAAATLFARIAASGGAPLPTRVVTSSAEVERGSAIIVGSMGDLGTRLVEEAGLADVLRSAWGVVRPSSEDDAESRVDPYEDVLSRLRSARTDTGPAATAAGPVADVHTLSAAPDAGDNDQIYDRWRSDIGGVGINAVFNRLIDWVRSTFGVTLDMLHLPSSTAEAVRLPPRTTAVIAQTESAAGGDATWTVVTAASGADLRRGVEGLTAPQTWNQIGGGIVGYQANSGKLTQFAGGSPYYRQTVPFSFANARLIAANWFSLNIVEYALTLILASAALGVLTWSLVRNTGRPAGE